MFMKVTPAVSQFLEDYDLPKFPSNGLPFLTKFQEIPRL